MRYPKSEIDEAVKDLLTAQFHDTLPGTSVEPVEASAIRAIGHGIEILSRVRARAFFKLAAALPKAKDDEIPIIVYNPHPYEVEGAFTCEMCLWDQVREPDVFVQPTVYKDGQPLPTQAEKELSNIPLEWRKRVVFWGKLAPSSMNFFVCKYETLQTKPPVTLVEEADCFRFDNGHMQLTINATTGLVDRYAVNGKEIFTNNAFEIAVYEDTADPWTMDRYVWDKIIGRFELLPKDKGSAFSGVDGIIPSVRVIEDGAVRTVIESVLGYNNSFVVMRYMLPKSGTAFDTEIRILSAEKQKMFKLVLPATFTNCICEGEIAFGREPLPPKRENVSQRYITFCYKDTGFAVANDCTYGSSWEDGKLAVTLLRTPAYTAHPWEDRPHMPQDRFSPYCDQGERLYTFRIQGGDVSAVKAQAHKHGVELNQPPYCLSFFPKGDAQPISCAIEITGQTVELTAFKAAQTRPGYVARIFNHSEEAVKCEIKIALLDINQEVTLGRYEAKTLFIENGHCIETDMVEGIANEV